MRTFWIAAATALALGTSGASLAGETFDKASSSISSDTIRKSLETMGYRVDRIKAEHDCYEVQAVNDSGFPIKATYDATSGLLMEAKLRRERR
jgi:hypothetical protein